MPGKAKNNPDVINFSQRQVRITDDILGVWAPLTKFTHPTHTHTNRLDSFHKHLRKTKTYFQKCSKSARCWAKSNRLTCTHTKVEAKLSHSIQSFHNVEVQRTALADWLTSFSCLSSHTHTHKQFSAIHETQPRITLIQHIFHNVSWE